MEKNEKEFYQRFLDKYITVTKEVNGKTMFYRGIVKAIFDDKLILADIKLGEIPISYDGMTVIGVVE